MKLTKREAEFYIYLEQLNQSGEKSLGPARQWYMRKYPYSNERDANTLIVKWMVQNDYVLEQLRELDSKGDNLKN